MVMKKLLTMKEVVVRWEGRRKRYPITFKYRVARRNLHSKEVITTRKSGEEEEAAASISTASEEPPLIEVEAATIPPGATAAATARRRRRKKNKRVRVRVRIPRKRNGDDDEEVTVRKSGEEEIKKVEEEEEPTSISTSSDEPALIEVEAVAIPPEHRRRLMKYDLLYWIIALIGSVMFGADMIIAEGLLLLTKFLVAFFPRSDVEKLITDILGMYCQYSDWSMRCFALLPFALGWVCGFTIIGLRRRWGPRSMMLMSSFMVIVGGVISAVTFKWSVLISGRILVGIGLAVARQGIPIFLEEVPPKEKREKLGIAFEMGLLVGNLVGNIVIQTEWVQHSSWRLALIPTIFLSVVIFVCSICVEESPKFWVEQGNYLKVERENSLEVERGNSVEVEQRYYLEAFRILERSRINGVQEEYERLFNEATRRQRTFVEILKRENRPYLIISTVSILFQCFMGASTLLLFLPTFLVVGIDSDTNTALLSSIVACSVSIVASGLSVYLTKRFQKRRISLLIACVVMVLAQSIVWIILFKVFDPTMEQNKGVGYLITTTMCLFVFASTIASGPMGWLSSNYPRQLVTFGRILTSSSNLVSSFVLAQVFLALLCQIQSWIFFLFAAVILTMFAFVYWFIPETTNMEEEEIVDVWRVHWFWRCCVNDVHGGAGQP